MDAQNLARCRPVAVVSERGMILRDITTYAKVPLTVARVAMRLAQPKVIPVVTANWPTKLIQPVIQLKNAASSLLGDSMAAQKYLRSISFDFECEGEFALAYGPPEVG